MRNSSILTPLQDRFLNYIYLTDKPAMQCVMHDWQESRNTFHPTQRLMEMGLIQKVKSRFVLTEKGELFTECFILDGSGEL